MDDTHAPKLVSEAMLTILKDAERRPELFSWFGAIPPDEVRIWSKRHQITPPEDFLDFLSVTGGGDAFESETILRPSVVTTSPIALACEDSIETRSEWHRAAGMPSEMALFNEGCFLSAICGRELVTLSAGYRVESAFRSFEEWYRQTLRAEFAGRYGLLG